jgi:hypothetical protein
MMNKRHRQLAANPGAEALGEAAACIDKALNQALSDEEQRLFEHVVELTRLIKLAGDALETQLQCNHQEFDAACDALTHEPTFAHNVLVA